MSELHFDSDGRDPSVDHTQQYINPVALCKYQFLTDTFNGSGGYRDGTYLIPHTREMFYEDRRVFSHYRNYLKPVTRALIDPVFMQDIPRIVTDESGNEISGDTVLGSFLEDCDNNATTLHDFMENVLLFSRLHGVTFVVVDNYPPEMQPDTINEAISKRIFPYAYLQTADTVEDYEMDPWGRLVNIMFYIGDMIVDDEKVKAFRKWDNTASQVFIEKKGSKKRELVAYGPAMEHGLGVLPVIAAFSTNRQQRELLVDPPLFDIARLNLSIYNKDSEVREQERSQSFSNFYIQSDEVGNMNLGPTNVIFVPSTATIPPGFASPDSSILQGLVENTKALVEALYQIAEQNGVKGVQSAKSGVAMQWDFYAHESQLKKTSRIATDIEHAIVKLVQLYAGTDYTYVVSYPTDFLPGDRNAEIGMVKEILGMDVPELFRKKLLERVARMVFNDEGDESLTELVDDIYKEKEDTMPAGDESGVDTAQSDEDVE